MLARCVWDEAYMGRCKAEALPGSPALCAKHSDRECSTPECNRTAVRTCDFAGQFVCGYPLCEACEHWWESDRKSGHRRKSTPVEEPAAATAEAISTAVHDLKELLVELEEHDA
jgi:hypothetical protein